MEPQENHISYKPSKKFLIRGGIATGIILIVLIVQADWFRGLFNKSPKNVAVITSNETVGGIIGKDTNGNGIPDWEERLWGLDPTALYTNGVSNKQLIEEKKKSLGVTDSNDGPLNETDILAQQLFSITSAINQSDQNDSGVLSSIGFDMGNSLKFKQVSNRYSLKNVKTTKTNTATLTSYYNSVTKISAKYKDEVAATDILVPALETGDFSEISKLQETANSYIAFSKSLQALTVPTGIVEQHLALINGFYGMADSFQYISQIEDNGVNALAGIAIYKNYALRVDKALLELNDYFFNYGIIN
jgi:hypothetical protein